MKMLLVRSYCSLTTIARSQTLFIESANYKSHDQELCSLILRHDNYLKRFAFKYPLYLLTPLPEYI